MRRWPRRGTVVVFREPISDVLAIKRVAAGPATGSLSPTAGCSRRRRGLALRRCLGRRRCGRRARRRRRLAPVRPVPSRPSSGGPGSATGPRDASGGSRRRGARLRSGDGRPPLAAAGFDPDAPLPRPPSRGTSCRCRADDGPPWAMAEMIAAEPALAARVAARLVADGSAAALAAAVRGAAAAGVPVVVTGCGTLEHAAMAHRGDPPRRLACRRAAGLGPGRRPGLRAGAGPSRGRPRHRDQPRGRHGRDDRGARAGRAARGARRRWSPASALTGRAGADIVARDRRDGPQLVPHRRLRLADRRRDGDRLGALGSAAGPRPRSGRLPPGHRRGARRRARRRPPGRDGIAAPHAAPTHLLVSPRAWTASRPAS